MSVGAPTAGQRLAQAWMMHRSRLTEAAGLLPEQVAAFRPWEGAMSTLELLNHIAGAAEMFVAAAVGRPARPAAPAATLAGARELLAAADAQAAEIGRLSEADLRTLRTVAALKLTVPAEMLLTMMLHHEIHHKGQVWTYARMNGVEPPLFVALD